MKDCRTRYFTLRLLGQISVLSCWIHGAYIFISTSLCHQLWNGLLATLNTSRAIFLYLSSTSLSLVFLSSVLSFSFFALLLRLHEYSEYSISPFWILCWFVSVRTDRSLLFWGTVSAFCCFPFDLSIFKTGLFSLPQIESGQSGLLLYIWVWIESCETTRWKAFRFRLAFWKKQEVSLPIWSAYLKSQKQWLWQTVHFNQEFWLTYFIESGVARILLSHHHDIKIWILSGWAHDSRLIYLNSVLCINKACKSLHGWQHYRILHHFQHHIQSSDYLDWMWASVVACSLSHSKAAALAPNLNVAG